MRASYVGPDTGNAHRFDAELIENVICNKMRLSKAADLDGITVEHPFYCHSLFSCVLAKLFNLIMDVGQIPQSFGLSYTVPILKKTIVFIVNLSQWTTSVESLSVLLCLKYLNTVSWIVLGIFSYPVIISLVLRNTTAALTRYTPCFRKKTSTHIIGYKLRNSCLILIIFDTKIPHII